MPGETNNMFFSFNMGPVHFISFSSEVYYFMNYGIKSLVFQYEWLEKDLIEATKPENRALRPWIIVRLLIRSVVDFVIVDWPESLVRVLVSINFNIDSILIEQRFQGK